MSGPREVEETDYVLDVVCDHSRNPLPQDLPPRIVSRVYYMPTPKDARYFGFMNWREAMLDEDPDYPPALQTYWDEVARLEQRFGPGSAARLFRDADRYMGSAGGVIMGGTRWRFWCRDCEDTSPYRGDLVEPIFAKLRDNGVSCITLRGLAALT